VARSAYSAVLEIILSSHFPRASLCLTRKMYLRVQESSLRWGASSGNRHLQARAAAAEECLPASKSKHLIAGIEFSVQDFFGRRYAKNYRNAVDSGGQNDKFNGNIQVAEN